MIKLNYFVALVLGIGLVFSACELIDPSNDEPTEAVIEFSVSQEDNSGSRVATDGHYLIPPCDVGKIASVFVKIAGDIEWEGEIKPKFFPGLGTWQMQLPIVEPGNYTLEEFLVLDENGDVVFATPHVGSAAAAFIENPVAFPFEVINGEKTITKVKVLCFDYGRLPDFGINILQFERCSIFKLWWFANVCDENGHREGNIKGYVVLPNGNKILGNYAHDFFYLPFIDCWSVEGEEVEIHIWVEDADIPQDGYYYWKLPTEFLQLYKNQVIHLNDDCLGWNWCQRDGYEMEARDASTYDETGAVPLD